MLMLARSKRRADYIIRYAAGYELEHCRCPSFTVGRSRAHIMIDEACNGISPGFCTKSPYHWAALILDSIWNHSLPDQYQKVLMSFVINNIIALGWITTTVNV